MSLYTSLLTQITETPKTSRDPADNGKQQIYSISKRKLLANDDQNKWSNISISLGLNINLNCEYMKQHIQEIYLYIDTHVLYRCKFRFKHNPMYIQNFIYNLSL